MLDLIPLVSAVAISAVTVPENTAVRSSASQISAGDSRSRVKLCDEPVSLVTVAFQMAFFSFWGGEQHPKVLQHVNTAVLLEGIPSTP